MTLGLLVFVWALAGSAVAQDAPAVTEATLEAAFAPTANEIFGHVAFLAHDRLKGRQAGSPEDAIAAAYVAAEFQKLGLEPAGEDGTYEQPFETWVMSEAGKAKAPDRLHSRNVLAWLPGSSEDTREYLLIGAHYDHLGASEDGTIYNGADDNASGVAGLLGVAKALATGQRPRRSILFVAFGGEEIGLLGSRHLAEHPTRELELCAAMVNLDMIGRSRFLDRSMLDLPKKLMGIAPGPGVGLLGGTPGSDLVALAKVVCAHDELPCYAPADFPRLQSIIEGATAGRGDFEPFRKRGVPTIFFSTSENDDYHQPTDTIAKVDSAVLHRIARVVYRFVLAVDALAPRVTEAEAGK